MTKLRFLCAAATYLISHIAHLFPQLLQYLLHFATAYLFLQFAFSAITILPPSTAMQTTLPQKTPSPPPCEQRPPRTATKNPLHLRSSLPTVAAISLALCYCFATAYLFLQFAFFAITILPPSTAMRTTATKNCHEKPLSPPPCGDRLGNCNRFSPWQCHGRNLIAVRDIGLIYNMCRAHRVMHYNRKIQRDGPKPIPCNTLPHTGIYKSYVPVMI